MSGGTINTPDDWTDEDIARVRAEWDRIVSDRRRIVVHTQDPETGEWHAWGPPTLMAIDTEKRLLEHNRRMFEEPGPWGQPPEGEAGT